MSASAVQPRLQPSGIPGLKWVLALALLKLLFLVAYSSGFGYMSDELYFLACAQHPAWGYADLPPLLPWLTWIVTHTLGSSLFAIRLYPAIASAITVVLAGWLAFEFGGGKRAVLLASAFVFIDPVTFGFGHILSTNALDLPLWLVCVLLMVKIEKGASTKLWLAWGATAGIVLLHKYTLAFLLAALVVGFLLTSWRRWLANGWFWGGVVLLLVMVLSNVLWQVVHDFPFLQLQHYNRVHNHNVNLPPLPFLEAQVVLHNPLVFFFAIAGLVFLFLPVMRRFRALAWTFVAFLLLMFALHARDYYLALAYPPLIAAGGVAVERWLPGRWPQRSVYAYAFVAAVLTTLGLPSFLPIFSPAYTAEYCNRMFMKRKDPENGLHTPLPDWVADQFGWRDPVVMVAKYYNTLPPEERAHTAILGNFYGQAGAIDFFGPALGLPKAISGHHSYWLWGSHGYRGESIIIMDPWPDTFKHCASVTLVGKPEIPFARPDMHPAIYHCRGLDFDLTQHWDYLRHYD
ncbi:MAG TPA: glycosyltransferase family 39 protein [Terriglobales bacterium]|nr:glycosyltransferase family 39 protein [Terriglobales bacterium]